MAKQDKEQRIIEIIADGQKANASFKEMSAAAAVMTNQLKKMAADDPARAQLIKDLQEMKIRLKANADEMQGLQKAEVDLVEVEKRLHEENQRIIADGTKINASLKDQKLAAGLLEKQLESMAADDPAREALIKTFQDLKKSIASANSELHNIKKTEEELAEIERKLQEERAEAARKLHEENVQIILDGKKVTSSLHEQERAAGLMEKQLREMSKSDPGRQKLLQDFHQLKGQIEEGRQELNGMEKASLAAKLGIGSMGDVAKIALGTTFGFLTAGGIQDILSNIIGFFQEGKEQAKKFGSALSELQGITGASNSDLEFYAEQAKAVGRVHGLAAVDVVNAYKTIGSAKPELLKNKEALASVTEEALALAQASKMELPIAADALASSLNQFGEEADQAGRFINVMAAGAKEGASEIADTAAALKNAGTVAAAANVSFEATNAMIQSLSEISIKGGEAGTGLRNVLLTLQSGADDTNPAIVGLDKAFENLEKKQLSTAEMSKVFGKENVVVAQHLLKSRERVIELTNALTGTNTAYEQQRINMDNAAGDGERFSAAFQGFMLAMASGATEFFRPFTQGATEVLNFFTGLISNTDKATEAFKSQKNAVQDLETNTVPLLDRYDELTSKAILSKDEQTELNTIIEKVAQTVPTAVTEFDKYGKALGISSEKAREFVEMQRAILGVKNKEAIEEQVDNLRKIEEQIDRTLYTLNKGTRTVTLRDEFRTTYQEVKLTADEILKMQSRLADLQTSKKGTQGLINELKGIPPVIKTITDDAGEESKQLGAAVKDNFEEEIKKMSIKQLQDLLENETDATHKKLIRKRIEYLKEQERIRKEHEGKVKRDREAFNQSEEKYELELAKLKIEIMDEGIDKVLAKLRFQHDQEIKELEKQRVLVLKNIAATAQEKRELLVTLSDQQAILEGELAEKEKAAKDAQHKVDLEAWYAQLDEEESYLLEVRKNQLFTTMDAEFQIEQVRLQLHRDNLAQRLMDLEASGQGETLAAYRLKNEILKTDKEKNDGLIANAEKTAAMKKRIESLSFQAAKDFFQLAIDLLSQDEAARKKNASAIKAFTIAKIMTDLYSEIAGYMNNPASTATMGVLGGIQSGFAIMRAGLAVSNVQAQKFAVGGSTGNNKALGMGTTIPMVEVNGIWEMASGMSGGSLGSFAAGGHVGSARLGLIGEAGEEWVMPNWMLTSPKYAATAAWLEAERQGGGRKFAVGGSTGAPLPASLELPENRTEEMLMLFMEKLDSYHAEISRLPRDLQMNYHSGNALEADNRRAKAEELASW